HNSDKVMDCATMRSDVIGDFQEPYGAVLVKRADMTALVSRNERLWNVRRHHSALMPAARITLPHFSVSSAMSLPKSAGEPGRTVPPRSPNRAFILGSARPVLVSWLSFSTISVGVFLGAPRPYTK